MKNNCSRPILIFEAAPLPPTPSFSNALPLPPTPAFTTRLRRCRRPQFAFRWCAIAADPALTKMAALVHCSIVSRGCCIAADPSLFSRLRRCRRPHPLATRSLCRRPQLSRRGYAAAADPSLHFDGVPPPPTPPVISRLRRRRRPFLYCSASLVRLYQNMCQIHVECMSNPCRTRVDCVSNPCQNIVTHVSIQCQTLIDMSANPMS